jgi:molybdate transport system ATP-binding protein
MQRLDLFPLTGRAEAGALIEARVERHDERFGLTELTSRAGLWRLPRLDAAIGTRLRLRVRARDVVLATREPHDLSALNILPGVVADIGKGDGPIADIRLDCNGDALVARLTRYSVERLGLAPGTPVFALVKSVALDRRSLSGAIAQGADAEAQEV